MPWDIATIAMNSKDFSDLSTLPDNNTYTTADSVDSLSTIPVKYQRWYVSTSSCTSNFWHPVAQKPFNWFWWNLEQITTSWMWPHTQIHVALWQYILIFAIVEHWLTQHKMDCLQFFLCNNINSERRRLRMLGEFMSSAKYYKFRGAKDWCEQWRLNVTKDSTNLLLQQTIKRRQFNGSVQAFTYSNLGANLGDPAYLIDGETTICSVTSLSSGWFFSACDANRLPDTTPPTTEESTANITSTHWPTETWWRYHATSATPIIGSKLISFQ